MDISPWYEFASNVIDSHPYNIIIKDQEKQKVFKRARNSISKDRFSKKIKETSNV